MSPSIATLAKATRVGLSAARTTEIQRRARADHKGMSVAVCAALGHEDDAIDIGAHEGTFMRQMVECAPGGRHLAVEPLPRHATTLRDTMPSNVIVEEYAVTDAHEPVEMDFLHVLNNTGYSGLRERDYPEAPRFQRLKVEAISLDTLVQRHGLRPRLIRVDVEGAELLVLEGARRTIAEHRPWLMVEHGSAAAGYGETSSTFYDLACDLDLRIYDFD
ncbi:MAG: FkbM family methyltransferase, partial [Solirubrobacteraceae bacterium]|nr:FkbM family methyltransferase [Solirubrobacteraceae bacterium]